MFEIYEDEDDQEVLRRSPVDTYYLEKMKVFEETFGIDKLQNSVFKLGEKIKDVQEARDAGEEISYILENHDLDRMMQVVDEFKTRHSTITDSINDTYRIGNKLLDFVEKQVIIDYHLRGEQAKMEQDYPVLVKKAQKFLGMQAYFDLTVQ